VSDAKLLNIGAFSVLTGLSISALRHYDEIGLLPPASVDATTAYRRYDSEQVAIGRLVRALRAVELPIDAIREVVEANDAAATKAVLSDHRSRLVERHQALAATLDVLDDYIENGVHMTRTTQTACRIVEINLGADDVAKARTFYESVFGVEFTEDTHGDGFAHLLASFGSWPSDEFFLLNISDATDDPYRAGRANFGFLVDDLDAVHARAVASGGTEISAPREMSGMPRASAIVDPGGNLINLYQNA
jgi:DNA-binding transcriptional MerR regulator/catechol 2,3-dioxygenase-like lactoylglutathione lyase family enzyme